MKVFFFFVLPLRSPPFFWFPLNSGQAHEFYSKSACQTIMAFNILQVKVNSLCQLLNANSHRVPGPCVQQSSRRASPLHLPCQHTHWGKSLHLTWPCPGYHMMLVINGWIRNLFCMVEGKEKMQKVKFVKGCKITFRSGLSCSWFTDIHSTKPQYP